MSTLRPRDITHCSTCGAPLSDSLKHCPSCLTDVGAPNVRMAMSEDNRKAIAMRYKKAREDASSNGRLSVFADCQRALKAQSGVVVCMPANIARSLFENPTQTYANYERLVGAKARTPAGVPEDRQRTSVGGLLFGSYANSIYYGSLSLTAEGLKTYGDVFCRLKNATIENRVSFLERNSYVFVEEHKITPAGGIPCGYTASWQDRDRLAVVKIGDHLALGQEESDWQELLIESDGTDRKKDEFIEAHIFGSFNRYSIESFLHIHSSSLSKTEKIDIRLAKAAFDKMQGGSI